MIEKSSPYEKAYQIIKFVWKNYDLKLIRFNEVRYNLTMCIFCKFKNDPSVQIEHNELAFVIPDGYPVSLGHTLIIPKRHIKSYFDLTNEELIAMNDLANKVKKNIIQINNPEGFNIGFNDGEVAGQTIMHCHMHIIPRFKGDVEDPRGGIRGVIPNKQKY